MLDGFLIGVIAAASCIAGLIFLRFWRDTKDTFFMAFAAAFTIEGVNRIGYLFLERPNEGAPWIYVVRLFAFLLILTAILRKNYGRG
jgi:uncharacterized membrane protein HdeD (DUF308 family)